MSTLNLTTALLGAGLAAAILVLVRRGHMQLSHGAFWITIAVVAVVLGFWPRVIDTVARAVGISYSPSFLLLIGLILLLIKALLADMAGTRLERQVRRLNQRLALHEAERDRAASPREADSPIPADPPES